MIPLQRPVLADNIFNQVRQIHAWAETLVAQLEMLLSAIPEDYLAEEVRSKLNAQSEQSRTEIQEIQEAIQGMMSQQKEMMDAIEELQGG